MTDHPWTQMGRPSEGLTLRRIDPLHPANFFWARDAHGRCALVLQVVGSATVDEARPRLNGIDIVEMAQTDDQHAFILTLRREEDVELFHRLCEDIVEVSRHLDGDRAFLAATIRRAWKWHSLLRGAGRARLGPEEQQGLIGELLFLESLAGTISPKPALEAWRGPLDEPKDFVFGTRAVEVKARHAGKAAIKISSEHQLQQVIDQRLFLLVHALTPTSAEAGQAFTLDTLVARVRDALVAKDPSSEEGFEARLLAAGYSAEHDYGDRWWAWTSSSAFEVRDGFPCIDAAGLASGVASVSYWIGLDACTAFETPEAALLEMEQD